MKRIYLDHAAATPIDPIILKVVNEAAKKFSGNPSAIHKEGVSARAAFEAARAELATTISAHPDEIIFTSGATEGNNLAISGVVQKARANGVQNPHVIVSAIEHSSVLEVVRALTKWGVRVDYLPVDTKGLVSLKELRKLITPETVLISVMYANNEVGTIEPIHEIAKEARHARKMNKSVYPYVHTDAAQCAPYLDLNVQKLGIDLMTLSSTKTYGPRGVGVLAVKRGTQIAPLFYGGTHESGLRPGTEAVSLALGFAEALAQAQKKREKESARLEKLRNFLAAETLKKISDTKVNGDLSFLIPHIVNISFGGVDTEALILALDAAGIAVSGKSACKSSAQGPSHVILAMGITTGGESGAIRFSLGRTTTREDIQATIRTLVQSTPMLRDAYAKSDIV